MARELKPGEEFGDVLLPAEPARPRTHYDDVNHRHYDDVNHRNRMDARSDTLILRGHLLKNLASANRALCDRAASFEERQKAQHFFDDMRARLLKSKSEFTAKGVDFSAVLSQVYGEQPKTTDPYKSPREIARDAESHRQTLEFVRSVYGSF